MTTPDWWSLVESPPAASSTPGGGGDDVEGYIRRAAGQRGIDPDTAIRVAQSEGGLVPNRTGSFSTGKSFWPFQLHYGGAGTPYASYGTVAGMGNAFTAATGWQPGDPNAWQAATDYALDQAKQSGWGQWYGARNVGITGFQGITRGGAAAPAPAPAATGTQPSGTPAWWSLVSDQGSGGPTAPDSARSAPARGGGAVFPVAGYTGQVALHHGSEQGLGGSDLFAPEGTPVLAMRGGTVQWASTNDSLGGNNVGIVGDDGLTYYYAHFKNAPRVKAGQRVDAGTQIGDVGRSGNAASTPSHLHIGIGQGIQTGAGALGGLGRDFDAVSYLRQTLTGAAPAHKDAPGVGQLTSPPPADAPAWWSLVT